MEGGAQVKQMINVECISEFKDHPLIDLQFGYVSLLRLLVKVSRSTYRFTLLNLSIAQDSFESDWSRNWQIFPRAITKRSKRKL